MEKNGFAPIIIILIIAILGVVGYFGYVKYFKTQNVPVNTPTSISNQATGLPIMGEVNGKTINVGIKRVGPRVGDAVTGTMQIFSGWNVVRNSYTADVPYPYEEIQIKSGKYFIDITYPKNDMKIERQSTCTLQNQQTLKVDSNAIMFNDKSGHTYIREGGDMKTSGSLSLCSTTGVVINGAQYFDGDGVVPFGKIKYSMPDNADNKILNQMDNMVASFKTDP